MRFLIDTIVVGSDWVARLGEGDYSDVRERTL